METVDIYLENNQYLEWAHKTSTSDLGKKTIPLTEKEYGRLVAYDAINQLRTEFLEELYKRCSLLKGTL